MTRGRRLLPAAGLGVALVALTCASALVHLTQGEPYPRLLRFLAVLALASLVYGGALALLLPARGRAALVLVVAVAVALRIVPMATTPFLSTDAYRYVWDGMVQRAGINPYRFVPADPSLASMRDAAVFPMINRPEYAPTIYPPGAQLVFAAVARLSPSLLAMKAAMLLAEAVAGVAMVLLLRRAGMAEGRLAIYAWNPLFAWEYAGNGHVDALALALIGIALLAAATRRPGWSGIALAGAVLTKFVPAVLAPALWRPRDPASKWRLPVAAVATVALAYLPYLSVGPKVFGFLGGYAGEEGLASGDGLYPLQLLRLFAPLPPWAGVVWLAVSAVALASVGLWIAASPRPASDIAGLGRDALLMAVLATLATSPHYGWYYGWLAYLCCLAPWPSVIFLTIACLACYVDHSHTNFGWATTVTAAFAVLAVRDLWRAASPRAAFARSI
ncbi:MAG: DUF2029 domain-containing protein [Acetobacteraceae bacterium]|nr:DUF2029 domain-containing protein [Acetobacteraceae bacterium]